jgi:hypothetical protein
MRRIIMAPLLTFVLLGTFGLAANAEMAKEGEGIQKNASSWTMKVINEKGSNLLLTVALMYGNWLL